MPFDIQVFEAASQMAFERLRRYFATLDQKPVRSQVTSGDIRAQLPVSPPKNKQSLDQIFNDFDQLADKGLTHWNHPRFFAYFPCSTSPIALAAEQLAAGLCQQGMLWQTSPLSTELEQTCIQWMIELLGLEASGFDGLINDTASTSTFSAVLMAREKATGGKARQAGLQAFPALRVYVSPEVHTSVNKAVWLAGLGADNVVQIQTDASDKMDLGSLRNQIKADRQAGLIPAMIVGAAGGTSVGAFDDLTALGQVAQEHKLFYHIDAAWAGVAAIVPEYRALFSGWELADSVVLNPHKWLMTGMECSVFLVKDMKLLRDCMSIVPTYLETQGQDDFINYSEYTPQLGRSFRSLKLWFLIKFYGAEGLGQVLHNHVNWSLDLYERLKSHPDISIVTEPSLSLFSFAPKDETKTMALLEAINNDGRIYLTQTLYKGRKAIRFVTGTYSCDERDVAIAGDVIIEMMGQV